VTTTIACVLRSGGAFGPDHVARLADQFHRHAPGDCPIVCLTDMVAEVEALERVNNVVALEHGWPGWWSKLEAFKLIGPVLYLDLGCTVIGSLARMITAIAEHDLLVARDFQPCGHVINSAVMGWRGDMTALLREFRSDPAGHMAPYDDSERWTEPGRGWGDQGYLRDQRDGRWACWQDVLPGAVMSYREDVIKRGIDTGRTAVIVSHGAPKPWQRGGIDQNIATGLIRGAA